MELDNTFVNMANEHGKEQRLRMINHQKEQRLEEQREKSKRKFRKIIVFGLIFAGLIMGGAYYSKVATDISLEKGAIELEYNSSGGFEVKTIDPEKKAKFDEVINRMFGNDNEERGLK